MRNNSNGQYIVITRMWYKCCCRITVRLCGVAVQCQISPKRIQSNTISSMKTTDIDKSTCKQPNGHGRARPNNRKLQCWSRKDHVGKQMLPISTGLNPNILHSSKICLHVCCHRLFVTKLRLAVSVHQLLSIGTKPSHGNAKNLWCRAKARLVYVGIIIGLILWRPPSVWLSHTSMSAGRQFRTWNTIDVFTWNVTRICVSHTSRNPLLSSRVVLKIFQPRSLPKK